MVKTASSLASCWRKLRADARQQHGKAERLGDVVVGAGFQAEDGVGIGVVAGQHDDRRLEAVLAQDAHRLAAVDVGQADVHDHQVDLAALGRLHALGAAVDRDGLELLMQRQLLDQRVAQFGIVVDDQDGASVGHRSKGCLGGNSREVEHSGLKEQGRTGISRGIGEICGVRRAKRETSLRRLPCGASPRSRRAAVLLAGPLALPVALGRGGIRANKREGDGATPRGALPAQAAVVARRPPSAPGHIIAGRGRIAPDDGWCEDPPDRHYNRPVKLAAASKADRLARAGRALRFHRRDRPQHAAAHRRPRQRRVHPRRRGRASRRPRAASRSRCRRCAG